MIDLRSHTPKGQRARAQILAVAEELLVERGFHGTSVRDIATAAKLPLATVVYHFARKEQLYAAVLQAIADDLMRGRLIDPQDAIRVERVHAHLGSRIGSCRFICRALLARG